MAQCFGILYTSYCLSINKRLLYKCFEDDNIEYQSNKISHISKEYVFSGTSQCLEYKQHYIVL